MSQVEHQYQIIFDTPGRVDSGSLLLGLHSAARELHPYYRAAASLKSPCQDSRWIGGAKTCISAGPFHSGSAVNVAGTTVMLLTAFRSEACPFFFLPIASSRTCCSSASIHLTPAHTRELQTGAMVRIIERDLLVSGLPGLGMHPTN